MSDKQVTKNTMTEKSLNDLKEKIRSYFLDYSINQYEEQKKIHKEIDALIEADLNLIDDYFFSFLKEQVSPTAVDAIYRMTQIIRWNKVLMEKSSQKNKDFNHAIQFLFDPYLRFEIPLNLWQDLADESWNLLKKYNSNIYNSIESFEKENQKHWATCCTKLQEFRDHPTYGEKIKAKDWGYV